MKKIAYTPEPQQKFTRRRCPDCNSGQYKPVNGSPRLRRCTHCQGVFDLELEGVVPGAKKKRSRKAAGSGVIAAPIEQKYRGYRWRNWGGILPQVEGEYRR